MTEYYVDGGGNIPVRSMNEPDPAQAKMKLVYIKRWRTIVSLPEKYASEIVNALRSPAGPTDPLQCLRCGTVDAFGPISAEKK